MGIIGIVASMTLPAVVARHRSKTLEAQFHKRYSELSQALLSVKKDEVYLYGTFKGREMMPVIAKQFKGSQTPTRYLYRMDETSQKNEIGFVLPKYKTPDRKSEYGPGYLDDGVIIVNKEFFIFMNNDGETLNLYNFIIDVNGLQGPNIMGYDVFVFELDKTDSLKTIARNDSLCNFKTGGISNGRSCSYYAMTDGNYFKNLGW